MNQKPVILVCDDDPIFSTWMRNSLKNEFECHSSKNGDEALALLKKKSIDLILLDVQLRTPDEGLKYIPKILEIEPDAGIIMITLRNDFSCVRESMRLGAMDFLTKQVDLEELHLVIKRVLDRKNLLRRQSQNEFEVTSTQKRHQLVGETAPIHKLRHVIEKIRKTSSNILITGETGTGKEVVARLLRRTLENGALEPFVAVDSSTIQNSTAESVLFGHERGAFTGADRMVKGVFEEAHGGTVYFDEVSNMSLEIQAKLLRVIQEKEVTRLGSSRVIPLDFRVICATNRKIEEMVADYTFKDDLYQRLNVIPIELCPLRERKEDIPLLIKHFLKKHAANRLTLNFTPQAFAILENYRWPGNIRELENLVAYLVTMNDSETVGIENLPNRFRTAEYVTQTTPSASYLETLREFERDLLSKEYNRFEGNISKLARTLGMDRSHLHLKLKQLKIHSPQPTRHRTR